MSACSWCGDDNEEITLVAGPHDLAICSDCIAVCVAALGQQMVAADSAQRAGLRTLRGVEHPRALYDETYREEAIRLRFVEGWTQEQISDHLGCNVQSVRRWIRESGIKPTIGVYRTHEKITGVRPDTPTFRGFHQDSWTVPEEGDATEFCAKFFDLHGTVSIVRSASKRRLDGTYRYISHDATCIVSSSNEAILNAFVRTFGHKISRQKWVRQWAIGGKPSLEMINAFYPYAEFQRPFFDIARNFFEFKANLPFHRTEQMQKDLADFSTQLKDLRKVRTRLKYFSESEGK